ncbi:hypothetical protein SxD43FB_22270 [Sphingobium sp. D43FB]|nr:hypothetical protein SxD43FB_22270 [Sphingobium sp. D43FB]
MASAPAANIGVSKKPKPPHQEPETQVSIPPITKASVDSPMQNLKDLNAAPEWRGCIDMFADWQIRGWALSTINVMRSVDLEIYICGILVTTSSTRYSRVDIDQIVGLPIKSGFQISPQAIGTECAALIFDALKKIDNKKQTIDKILSIKIKGSDSYLPFSSRLRNEKVDISTLMPALDKIIGVRVRNEYISIRDSLIDGIESPLNSRADLVKPIAFYLPQFHPFPENNEWWGDGFTEWTNVTAAKSYWPEHYQPHVPADFGYYDLRVEDVQRKQIDLAKKFGIQGFCYYYYWFSGKNLMTMPIDRHVEKDFEFDFCLCWANENWSRRWDGSENDVLMAQRHIEEDDVSFINSCIKYFKSSRYITIDGAPLLLVYRVSLLQNPSETIARWRAIVKEAGFPDLHVSMVESFGLNDPHAYGCDSGCQFPPHGVVAPEINSSTKQLDPSFRGRIYDYQEVVRTEIARPKPSYTQFRCAMPSWDNTSRKGLDGNVFAKSSPELFETWLSYLINQARENLPVEQRFVFINAWNEWAEGAHLEPDSKNGQKFLQAVRRALSFDRGVMSALDLTADTETVGRLKVGELKAFIEKIVNANHQLQKLMKNYDGAIPDRASPFVAINSQWVCVEQGNVNDRAWLDSINGRPGHESRQIVMSREQSLSLRGWIHAPDASLTQALPIFICLEGIEGTSAKYMAGVYDREARPDIVGALNLGENSLWCGFAMKGDLVGVAPGRYRITALLAIPGELKSVVRVDAFIELLVA